MFYTRSIPKSNGSPEVCSHTGITTQIRQIYSHLISKIFQMPIWLGVPPIQVLITNKIPLVRPTTCSCSRFGVIVSSVVFDSFPPPSVPADSLESDSFFQFLRPDFFLVHLLFLAFLAGGTISDLPRVLGRLVQIHKRHVSTGHEMPALLEISRFHRAPDVCVGRLLSTLPNQVAPKHILEKIALVDGESCGVFIGRALDLRCVSDLGDPCLVVRQPCRCTGDINMTIYFSLAVQLISL